MTDPHAELHVPVLADRVAAVLAPAIEAPGAVPVSYTHLTLPTKA